MRFALLGTVVAAVAGARLTIDPMKHSVTPVTRSDFDAVISKFRDRQVAVVYYYKPDGAGSSKYFEALNSVALELRGMFRFAAVNCDDQYKLCKDESVSADDLPVVMLYPLLPLTAEPLPREEMENLGDEKGLKKTLFRLLPSDHVDNLDEGKIDAFLAKEEHLPKVILFSNKKSSPPLFKALSTEFSKEMQFGFYPSPTDEMLRRFKLKPGQVPKLVMHESNKKVQIYDGELSFQAIHEWVNLRRETFARGGGFDHSESTASSGTAGVNAKPWLAQEVPEVYKQSHKDLCFKHEEGLCVIYLREGEISSDEISMVKSVKAAAGEEVHFRFMWMDLAKENEFRELFAAESLPNVIVFNPHKRLRYTAPLDEPVGKADIQQVLEKIVAGEGRFKVVAQLPEFVNRKQDRDEL